MTIAIVYLSLSVFAMAAVIVVQATRINVLTADNRAIHELLRDLFPPSKN